MQSKKAEMVPAHFPHNIRYQAASWDKARRVVAKVEHHQGEVFPRVGFIVTSLSLPSRAAVVRFYNKRGVTKMVNKVQRIPPTKAALAAISTGGSWVIRWKIV
jgi:Transposase DDE domain group 1